MEIGLAPVKNRGEAALLRLELGDDAYREFLRVHKVVDHGSAAKFEKFTLDDLSAALEVAKIKRDGLLAPVMSDDKNFLFGHMMEELLKERDINYIRRPKIMVDRGGHEAVFFGGFLTDIMYKQRYTLFNLANAETLGVSDFVAWLALRRRYRNIMRVIIVFDGLQGTFFSIENMAEHLLKSGDLEFYTSVWFVKDPVPINPNPNIPYRPRPIMELTQRRLDLLIKFARTTDAPAAVNGTQNTESL